MNGNEYAKRAMRTNDGKCTRRLFIKAQDSFYKSFSRECDAGEVVNAALGITGEAGEVADIVKKWAFHEHALDREHLKKECGDVLWYIALLCSGLDLDFDEIMQANIEKLENRYPDGFNAEQSKNRKAGDV